MLLMLLSLVLAGPAASAHNASPELVHEMLGNDMPGFLIKPTQGEVVHDANLFWDGDAYRLVTPSRKTLLLDPSGAYLRLMVSPEHLWTLVYFRWEFPDTNEVVEMTVRPNEALEVYNQEMFDGFVKAAPRIQFHIKEK